MILSSWIRRFRNRLNSASCSRRVRAAETLEHRAMLSVNGVLIGTDLSLFVDEGDDISVQNDPGTGNVQVLVNGAPATSVPAVQSSALTGLSVFAGDDDNVIDLSGITSADFAALAAAGAITVDAGDGDDNVTGSADFGEVFRGQDGDDTIDGSGGDDTINGGDGADNVTGGIGLDSIDGGDGNDTIDGGDDNDSIASGNGADSVTGGLGNDTIDAGQGFDTVDAGDGDDSINGMSGNDSLIGGLGNDTILGGSQHDVIAGGDGDDSIDAQGGRDTVTGDDGNDNIVGGQQADSIDGGQGNDTLNGMSGSDRVAGQDGNDVIFGGGGADELFGDGTDSLSTASGDDTVLGNSGDDSIIGGNGADSLDGGSGADLVRSTFPLSIEQVVPPAPQQPPPPTNPTPGSSILDDAIDSGGGTDSGATTVNLLNGPGDASVDVTLNSVGEFGSFSDSPGLTDAIYDPVGAILPAGTTFESYIFYRPGSTGTRQELFTAATNLSTIRATATEANSTFSIGNLNFALVQLLEPIPDSMGMQTGTLLTQTYTITNAGGSNEVFELLRYLDGDLDFDGSISDGGGRLLTANNEEIIFETDSGGSPATATTFVGLTGFGGTVPATGRYELTQYDVTSMVRAGTNLTDSILNDGDGDGFIDLGSEFDVTLNLQNNFDIAAGASVVYTTHTLFGSGPPNQIVQNNGPTATDDTGTLITDAGTTLTIDVVSNDSDPDGVVDFSTVTITTPPTQGSAVSLGNGLVAYTANPGASGTDTFQYTVADNTGAVSVPATVTITIQSLDSSGDTLVGGDGRDTLVGSGNDDSLNGGMGNDSIDAQAGNDTVLGGAGNDMIDGGAGDDRIDGQSGDDTISTGSGDDVVIWNGDGDGVDVVNESTGAQTIAVMGTAAADDFTVDSNSGLLRVSEGSSSITASSVTTSVSVLGGNGDDTITLNSIDDVRPLVLEIDGQGGNDTIRAMGARIGNAQVSLNGGAGADTINGGADGDNINGGDGDDLLSGSAGGDVIDGGAGNDVINGEDGNDSLIGNVGNDTLNGGDDDDSLSGSFGDDVLMGNNGNDTIRGGFGNDNLNGSAGDDLLDGEQDNDTLAGGSGNDRLDGGTGNDTVKGQNGDDQIKGGDGNDRIEGNSGADTIDAGDGNDTVLGGNGRDLISGGDGDDSINGMSGQDTLIGGDGNDTLLGGGSTDQLFGGEGTDTLRGNAGTDRFNSGQGGMAPKDLAMGETDDQNLTISLSVQAALAALSGF